MSKLKNSVVAAETVLGHELRQFTELFRAIVFAEVSASLLALALLYEYLPASDRRTG